MLFHVITLALLFITRIRWPPNTSIAAKFPCLLWIFKTYFGCTNDSGFLIAEKTEKNLLVELLYKSDKFKNFLSPQNRP